MRVRVNYFTTTALTVEGALAEVIRYIDINLPALSKEIRVHSPNIYNYAYETVVEGGAKLSYTINDWDGMQMTEQAVIIIKP